MIDPKKSLYALAAIAAAAMFASCEPVVPTPEPEPEPVRPDPITVTVSFALPSGGEKTAWVAGDQIVVHGEYAAEQVTVTLEAGDISSDGKTATKEVANVYPYNRDDCGSILYASWPASASSNLRHCFFYSGFNTSNALLLAACNDANYRFDFKQVTGALAFTVKGDFDSYAITGRKDAVVGYNYYQVKITDNEQNFNQYRQDPMVTMTGDIKGSGKQQIYFPADAVLPSGFVLKFFKNGQVLKAYTSKNETVIKRGEVLDLGDITSKLADYEQEIDVSAAASLAEEETANCYIVKAAGVYKFPAVKGNTNDSVGSVEKAVVLWETWNNVEEVAQKSVIQSAMYEGGFIYFQVPEKFHAGNALIAALDENEVPLWSWHIWIPQTDFSNISEANVATREMMSRNLGALVDAPADGVAPVESFGVLYQWGRKDPFPGIGDAANNTPATVAGTAITYVNDQISLAGGAQNPTTFYYVDDKDWQNEGLDVVAALWGEAKKTVNDPCPPGYVLPARESGPAFWASSDIIGASYVSLEPDNCVIKVGAQVFPLTGYIDDADGTHKSAGQSALIWSGRWDSGTQNGYGFSGTVGGDFRRRGTIRSRAGAVRCVKL